MKDQSGPAFPVSKELWRGLDFHPGMTKRELIAMHALQGLLANSSLKLEKYGLFAKDAVGLADAMLAELGRE